MKDFACLVLLLLAGNVCAQDLGYPKLFFKYSFLYDTLCPPAPSIKQAWADEAESREAEFAAIWEKDAPLLFAQVFKDFGKGFTRKEMTATLSVCNGGASFSEPLVLNVTKYLKSYMNTRPVRPDYAFVDLTFHELTHTWVDENLKHPTPLLVKYQNENSTVRNHLHLMALQKQIYTELGRTEMLSWIGWLYPAIGGDYGRAWEIVNQEGAQAFTSEF